MCLINNNKGNFAIYAQKLYVYIHVDGNWYCKLDSLFRYYFTQSHLYSKSCYFYVTATFIYVGFSYNVLVFIYFSCIWICITSECIN